MIRSCYDRNSNFEPKSTPIDKRERVQLFVFPHLWLLTEFSSPKLFNNLFLECYNDSICPSNRSLISLLLSSIILNQDSWYREVMKEFWLRPSGNQNLVTRFRLSQSAFNCQDNDRQWRETISDRRLQIMNPLFQPVKHCLINKLKWPRIDRNLLNLLQLEVLL